ncbi:MAG: hypothetical protein QOD46_656, partial [Actinomycetota bacterium]|nr:hypothetical protein [Actinomycetota bacterium]
MPLGSWIVLVGRDGELARLTSLLKEARRGAAGALLIRGEAGLGKTALLEATTSLAPDFKVLRARGVESEGEIPYAVILELLSGVSLGLEMLPSPLRAALEAACRLRPFPGGDSVVTAAWATLLTAVSETKPVLVIVDDIQWVDRNSAESVLFAARRVHEARVATVLAIRQPLSAAIRLDGLERLELGPLDDTAARALIAGAKPAV